MPTNQIENLHWYALRAPASQELEAAGVLARYGITCIVPTETKYRRANRYAKRKREILLTLYPRYIFCGFETDPPPWYEIFQLPVVQGVVSVTTDGTPSKLRRKAVAELIEVHGIEPMRAPRSEQFMPTHREFKQGETVRITDGAYADRTVVVDRIHGHLAEIMLPLFGADMPVKVPLAFLEAA